MNRLAELHKGFVKKASVFSERASQLQSDAPSLDLFRVRHLTEGVISDLWQSWATFCRDIVIESCSGCVTRSGTIIPARSGNNSWQRIGYEATCAAKKRALHPHKINNFMRYEPTWGDVGCLISLIQAIKPMNSPVLLTAFGLPLLGPVHLQRTRNACFHKNVETLRDVRALFIYYSITKFSSPSDLAWQLDPAKSTLAIFSWIDDMEEIVDKATL